jgi:hypothetical protein
MFTRLNTILLPDKNFTNKILKTALSITKGKETEFVVDNKNYFVHLTIYSPEYPTKNIEKVIEEVKNYSKNIHPYTLSIKQFIEGEGFVMIDFDESIKMKSVHKQFIQSLSPLREGRIRDKYKAEIEAGKYPPKQIRLINQYGYHNVEKYYEPHLSICKFSKRELALGEVNKLNSDFKCEEIVIQSLAVAEMGPNGTCTKILKCFDLK